MSGPQENARVGKNSGNIGSMSGRGKTGEKGRGNCATTSRFVLNLGLWGFEFMMAFFETKI